MFLNQIMDTQIRNLYLNMKQNPKFMRSINQRIEKDVKNLLENKMKHMTENECEQYKETALIIATIGEEGGFVEGFKYVVN